RRHLADDIKALGVHATDQQKTIVQQRQNALTQNIDSWTKVQMLYMPVATV
ncbi:hypothetical protein BV22DRAFT_985898, partial [Leucogyrophana mollusca]